MAILVVLVGLGAGAFAAIRWIPHVGSGQVGEFVFWLVCGLVAVATAVLVLGLYEALRVLDDSTDAAASQALAGLKDAAILLGIATGVYLLAGPRASV